MTKSIPLGFTSRYINMIKDNLGIIFMLSAYYICPPILAVNRNVQTAHQGHLYCGGNKPANDVQAEDVDMRFNLAMDTSKALCLYHFIIQYFYLKVLQNKLTFLQ